ncbi:two-component sensor histidine kinase [Paenibacillus sp. CAA11]|uniref:sensor histidine kinase n=1 Tax=Paenibacillus sp. CAA11 TaxID=1532905 RepID=UPI000D33BABC|nr:HAMP domain-containing sensor histidine kinase [Paenibacillus sp. CAA11]AWB44832.1 two-component sensor histidine kinase [Paenibacillus sp. CAA11]
MIKKGIGRQIVLHYFIVVFVTLLMVEIIFLFAIRTYYYDSVYDTLKSDIETADRYFETVLKVSSDKDSDYLPVMLQSYSSKYAELQILDREGHVLINSTNFIVDKPIQTSDVPQALAGNISKWIGRQPGTGESVMAVSSPFEVSGEVKYIVRYVTSLDKVNAKVLNISLVSSGVGVAVLTVVLLFSMGLANSIVKPINNIQAVSSQMARGKFDVRVKGDYKYELGQLASTLNFMAQEIVRSNQIKDDFITSISHELRTPLTGIKGWSETLTSGGFDPEETKLGMQIIAKETDRLIGLVEEMLDFSKLQQNEMKLVLSDVNLVEILQETMLNVWVKAEQKQIQLQLDNQTGEPVRVYGDPNRLKQVFLNLVDNATKFSHENSTIALTIRTEGEYGVAEVTDTGIGISEEHLRKVKDRFFQVNHQGGGTGLGLAITQQLVELHKGIMDMQSELGVGTRVIVKLPLYKGTEETDQTDHSKQISGGQHMTAEEEGQA